MPKKTKKRPRNAQSLGLVAELSDLRRRTRSLGAALEAMRKQVSLVQHGSDTARGILEDELEACSRPKIAEEARKFFRGELGGGQPWLSAYLAGRGERQGETLARVLEKVYQTTDLIKELESARDTSAASLERIELGLARLELESRP